MGMTIAGKILAHHTGSRSVTAGDLIRAKLDIVLANDVTAPLAIEGFEKVGAQRVFDKEKIVFVLDHFIPSSSVQAAEKCAAVRRFVEKHSITHLYDVGRMGIEHALLPELGIVLPGDLVAGGDSHTCSYGALGAFSMGVGSTDVVFAMAVGEVWIKVPETIKIIYRGNLKNWVTAKDLILYTISKVGVEGATDKVMEFCGEIIQDLPMDGRFTICNMAIEAGAMSGIIEPDEITLAYIRNTNVTNRKFSVFKSDGDSTYCQVLELDCSDLEPQVALPHSPGAVKSIKDVGNVPIDQAVIGSCTNGRITDLRMAAKILKGRKANKNVRLLIFPATPNIYRQAMEEGLIGIFLDAEAAICTSTCGPCFGGSMGLLAEGERCVSTTNRNFRGRMGHPQSEVYLSSPAVAAASAVMGRLAHPEEVA